MNRAAGSRAMVVVVALLAMATLRAPRRRRGRPTVGGGIHDGLASVTRQRLARGLTALSAGQDSPSQRRHGTRRRARPLSDADGRFRFERVEPGAYVVELLSPEDKVLAIGDLFGVTAGGQVTTLVRLSSKAPWFGGFFGNAAAAAIAAASTLGVTAIGSNGSPASRSVDADAHPCSTSRISNRPPRQPIPPSSQPPSSARHRCTCSIA